MGSSLSQSRTHRGRRIGAVALLGLGAPMLAACGSSAPKSASVSAVLGSPLSQACTAIGDVLGNGPDPGADPVGYALAQPIQLLKVHTSDAKLRAAVVDLADAYRRFASSDGSKASAAAVKAASSQVDAICPGATQS